MSSPPPAPPASSALYAAAALLGLPVLADKGYDGVGIGVYTPAKGGRLAPSTACRNQLLTRLPPKASAASRCSRPDGKRYTAFGCVLSESAPSSRPHLS
jgi:hypothetical protein